MSLLKDAVGKLQALGSADQIALFLEQEEVKGVPFVGTACPVTRYLEMTLELDEPEVSTSGYTVSVNEWKNQSSYDPTYHESVVTQRGTPIQEFVHKFDGGYYPNLIED